MQKQPSQIGLNIYTIFFNPSDYPDYYVCRKFIVNALGSVIPEINMLYKSKSVENIRFTLSNMGLNCIGRENEDDPVILESWV